MKSLLDLLRFTVSGGDEDLEVGAKTKADSIRTIDLEPDQTKSPELVRRQLLEDAIASNHNTNRGHLYCVERFNTTFSQWDKFGDEYRADLVKVDWTKTRIHWLHFYSSNPRETAKALFPGAGVINTAGVSNAVDPNPLEMLEKFLGTHHKVLDSEERCLFLNIEANFREIIDRQERRRTQSEAWDFRVWHQKDAFSIPRYAKSLCIPFPTHAFANHSERKFDMKGNVYKTELLDREHEARSQLIAFASKTILITIAPVPRDSLRCENITISSMFGFEKRDDVIRVTTEHKQAYVFPFKYCKTWFAFLAFVYTNCFRDWKSAENTNLKFIRMDPADGTMFRPITEVTEFNWIQNLSIHDGIVLDLMLFVTSEEVDEFGLGDTSTISNLAGPELIAGGKPTKHSTSAHRDRFSNFVNKPRAYVPLKQLHTKSESLEILRRLGALLRIEVPNSLLELDQVSTIDPLEKLNATLSATSTSQSGGTLLDDQNFQKLMEKLDSIAETQDRSNENKKYEGARPYVDTQVRDIGKPHSWKAPFGRLEYRFPESLRSPEEEFIGSLFIRDQSPRLSSDTYKRSASPEHSEPGSLVPEGSISDHPRWNAGGPFQASPPRVIKKTVRIAVSLDSLSPPVSPTSFLSPNWHANQSDQPDAQALKQYPEEPEALSPKLESPQISAPKKISGIEDKVALVSQPKGRNSEDAARDVSQLQVLDSTVQKPIPVRKMSRGVQFQNTQRPTVQESPRPEPARLPSILRTPTHKLEVSKLPPQKKELISTKTPMFKLPIGLDHLQSEIMAEWRGRKDLGLKIPSISFSDGSKRETSFQESFGKDLDSLIAHAMDSNLAGTLKVGKYNLLRHLEKDRTNTYAQLVVDSPAYSTRSKPLQIHGKNFANAMGSVTGIDSKRFDSKRKIQEGDKFFRLTSSLFDNFFDTQPMTSRIGTAKLYWLSVDRILSLIESFESEVSGPVEDDELHKTKVKKAWKFVRSVNTVLEELEKQFSRIHHAWHIRVDNETGDSVQPSTDTREAFGAGRRMETHPHGTKRHFYVLPSAFVDLFLVLTEYLVLVHAVLDPKVEISGFISSSKVHKDLEQTSGPTFKDQNPNTRLGIHQPKIKENTYVGMRSQSTQTETPDTNTASVAHSPIETHIQPSQNKTRRFSTAASEIHTPQEPRDTLRPFQSPGKLQVSVDAESDDADLLKRPTEHTQYRSEDQKLQAGKPNKTVHIDLAVKIQKGNAALKKLQAQLKSLMSEGFHELIKMEGFAYGEYADHRDSPNAESILLKIIQNLLDTTWDEQILYYDTALSAFRRMSSNGLNRNDLYRIRYLLDHTTRMAETVLEQQLQVLNSCEKSSDWSNLNLKLEHLLCNTATARMNQMMLEKAILTVGSQRNQCSSELNQRFNQQYHRVQQIIELRKDTSDTATLVFTIVTTIFLPLSFVTGYFGMNTVDIRDTTSTTAFFWKVSVTMLVVFLVTLIPIAFYLRPAATFVYIKWPEFKARLWEFFKGVWEKMKNGEREDEYGFKQDPEDSDSTSSSWEIELSKTKKNRQVGRDRTWQFIKK